MKMSIFYKSSPLRKQIGRLIRNYIAPRLFLCCPWVLPRRFLPRPWRIYMDLGPACTCRCKQCDFWKLPTNLTNELTLSQRKEIIEKFYDWLGSNFEILFIGGELLIHKSELLKLIRFASRKGIQTSFVSNGTLIDENTAKELIESGLSKIAISLDGITDKTHDYLRGVKGVSQKAKKAILYLNKLRSKRTPMMSLKISTILMKQNLNEIEEIVNWVKKIGIDGINFNALFFQKQNSETNLIINIGGQTIFYGLIMAE